MLKLDDEFLNQVGLSELPQEDKKRMLAHVYETLELRVGTRLAQNMSDEQLSEFEKLMDANDETGALVWLETNVPDYKEVVSAELDNLKSEITTQAPSILAASDDQAA